MGLKSLESKDFIGNLFCDQTSASNLDVKMHSRAALISELSSQFHISFLHAPSTFLKKNECIFNNNFTVFMISAFSYLYITCGIGGVR